LDSTVTTTYPQTALEHHRTIFDGWRSISVSLYMTLVGYSVLVGVPVISSAWVELLGFTDAQVGRIAGADLGGMSLGAVLTSLVIGRINRRLLILVGTLLAVLANGLCMVQVQYEEVLWLRVIAGVGSGIYTATAVATLGATSRPARAFNMLLFAFAFSQALEMHLLPQLSMNGIYSVFIALYVVGLFFLHWIPSSPETHKAGVELDVADSSGAHSHVHQHVPRYVPWLCLGAIFFAYINIGAYWTYIELAGVDAGVQDEWLGQVLVWASFMGITGCLVATVVSNRFGLARPLLLALLFMAWIVGMLGGSVTSTNIMFSVCIFNFLWIFIDVYQMGTLSNIDRAGVFVSLTPGAQGLGQIVGPNVAASMLEANLGYGNIFVMCASASLAALIIYGVMYMRLRRIIPALADAG